jgi:hypothetical protein
MQISELLLPEFDQEMANNTRSCSYSGFSVDNSVYLAPGDTIGLEPPDMEIGPPQQSKM